MKFSTDCMSVNSTPFRYSRGCWWGFCLRMDLKKGEQADRMSLCAWICLDPQLRVQSKKSFSSLISLKATLMLLSKSFQRRQNFSLELILKLFNCLFFVFFFSCRSESSK